MFSRFFRFPSAVKGPTVEAEDPGKTLWNLVKDDDVDEDEDDVTEKVKNFFKTYSNINKSVVNWANPDDNDSTPLYLTATEESYNPVVTRMLISKRADVNKANRDGETPLYRAAADGLSDVVWRLIFEHADVNKANNNGETPLDIARKNRDYYKPLNKHKHELYASIVKELKKLKKRGGSKNLKKTKRRHNKKRKSVKKKTN